MICTDCRLAIEQQDRDAFAAEFGDHGLGFVRPHAVRDLAEADRLEEERAHSDFRDIYTLGGEPSARIDWREARLLAAHVRALTRAHAEALACLAAGGRRGAGPKRGPCQCYTCLHTRLPRHATPNGRDRR